VASDFTVKASLYEIFLYKISMNNISLNRLSLDKLSLSNIPEQDIAEQTIPVQDILVRDIFLRDILVRDIPVQISLKMCVLQVAIIAALANACYKLRHRRFTSHAVKKKKILEGIWCKVVNMKDYPRI
jgi:hypothetical protein